SKTHKRNPERRARPVHRAGASERGGAATTSPVVTSRTTPVRRRVAGAGASSERLSSRNAHTDPSHVAAPRQSPSGHDAPAPADRRRDNASVTRPDRGGSSPRAPPRSDAPTR